MNMDYPEFPLHPEPRSFAWSKLEIACIEKYTKACIEADRAQRAALGVQGGEATDQQLSAAMAEGNQLGIKSTDALRILAAYRNAAQPPQQSAQPIGVIRKNTMNGVLVDWHGPVKAGTKLYAAAQPVEASALSDIQAILYQCARGNVSLSWVVEALQGIVERAAHGIKPSSSEGGAL